MNPIYTGLSVGLFIGLALLIPLSLQVRNRYKAIGYASGRASCLADQQERLGALNADLCRVKHARDLEKKGHQQRIESILQDCDARIAVYARRANPFTEQDRMALSQAAQLLGIAATTFHALDAPDQGKLARQANQGLLDMAARLRTALKAADPEVAV
ncbi:hypothetical protein [Pseudomonas sp. RL_15y_Pfl2_60]|uniref:hypothetical protein n=1 Tax=Pseudomonas sp. RL_15y_Pfl2_60 TaxID=3088709 RepID=UPI0030DA6B42